MKTEKRTQLPSTRIHFHFFHRFFLWLLIFGLISAALVLGFVVIVIKLGFPANPDISLAVPLLLLGSGIAAVSLLFALLISLRIAGPIERIKKYVELFSAGDFSNEFSVRENDELYDLALALRRAAEQTSIRLENIELVLRQLEYTASTAKNKNIEASAQDVIQDFKENFKYKKITGYGENK